MCVSVTHHAIIEQIAFRVCDDNFGHSSFSGVNASRFPDTWPKCIALGTKEGRVSLGSGELHN